MTTRPVRPVTVAGVGLALPSVKNLDDLGVTVPTEQAALVDPAARIGKRGLRYKDRATQLALCAAFDALTDAGLLDDVGSLTVDADSVGVMASSNLGNLDTVCRVAATIADEGVPGTSPMDLPNASSNVVASSIAIRFGLRATNMMVCNGATSGLDSIYLAATLIGSGRLDQALVVGVETSNEVVERFTGIGAEGLLDGAVALVLRAGGDGRDGGTGVVGGYTRTAGLAECVDAVSGTQPPVFGVWYVPAGYQGGALRPWLDDVPRADLTERFGRSSGALGVLQCAAAVGRMRSGDRRPALVTTADSSHGGAQRDPGCAGMVLLP